MVLRYIYKAMFTPIEVFNDNINGEKLIASTLVVMLTAVLTAVLLPVVFWIYFNRTSVMQFDPMNVVSMFVVGLLTWLVVCALFWTISKVFHKGVKFKTIAATWGYSYLPNAACVVLYLVVQLQANYLLSHSILGIVVNTLFIMILVWKTIFYFIEMKYVIKTTGFELLIATFATGIAFALFLWIGAMVGIQVPML